MNEITRRAKLLKDYAAPDYVIEEVELDLALEPKATRIASKLRLRPNPKAGAGGNPLVLDGEGLALESVALDGKALAPADYELKESTLIIPRVPEHPFTLEACHPLRSRGQHRAFGPLSVARASIAPNASRKASAASPIFLDRPDNLAVFTVRIEADREQYPVLLSNGKPIDAWRTARRAPFCRVARSLSQAVLSLRAGGGRSRRAFATASSPCRGRKVELAIYVEHRQRDRAHIMRWIRSSAR